MKDLKDLDSLLLQFKSGELEKGAGKSNILNEQGVFLYGAGNIGKRLYHNLTSNNVKVLGFIDRNPSVNVPGVHVPVYQPNDPLLLERRTKCAIILSGVFSISVCNEIKSTLSGLGYEHVYALHEVDFSTVNNGSFYGNLFDDTYNKVDILGKDRVQIESAYSLFHETKDRELFLQHLKAHLTMDFARLPEPHEMNLQYLAHDIECHKDYSRLIDCGGYDGDTYRQLISQGHAIEHLAAFEPQVELYRKYASTIKDSTHTLQSASLFPCGVHSETMQMRFANCSEATSTGKVDASGDDLIQCVKLDEALHGFAPTFIKMDIEGAETAALNGAANMIEEHAPQLAICVYHSLSDLWEVPNIINGIRDDYRYHMRSYNYMGLETVLYAFPSQTNIRQ